MQNMKGRPDPNGGPNGKGGSYYLINQPIAPPPSHISLCVYMGVWLLAAEQWKMLLNVPGKDTRTGHDKSSAMLAMIIAHEGALLDVLYKVKGGNMGV